MATAHDPRITQKLADITRSTAGAKVRTLRLVGEGPGQRIHGEVCAVRRLGNHEQWQPTTWLTNGRHQLRPELNLPFNLAAELAALAPRHEPEPQQPPRRLD